MGFVVQRTHRSREASVKGRIVHGHTGRGLIDIAPCRSSLKGRQITIIGHGNFKGGIFYVGSLILQHCFICRPSDCAVSVDAGIVPRIVGSLALKVRCSDHSPRSHPHSARSHHTRLGLIHKHSARSHPQADISHSHSARSHSHFARSPPHSARSHAHSARSHHTRLDLIHIR